MKNYLSLECVKRYPPIYKYKKKDCLFMPNRTGIVLYDI